MTWWTFFNNVLPCLGVLLILILLAILITQGMARVASKTLKIDLDKPLSIDSGEKTEPYFNEKQYEHEVEIERLRNFYSDEQIRERVQNSWGKMETDRAFDKVDKPSLLGWLFWD